MRAYREKWAQQNPEKQAEAVKKHRASNMPIIRQRGYAWRANNPDKVRAADRRRYAANAEVRATAAKEWRRGNPEKAKLIRQKAYAKRAWNPQTRLENAIRASFTRGLAIGAKRGRKTWQMLGFTQDQLRQHLEALFARGMTWGNYGEWHVDHVIPLVAFNYETPDDIDFQRAWALTNLQPLWAADNQSKSGKLGAPFQPSLAI